MSEFKHTAGARVRLKSGGTSSCWFETYDREVNKELMDEFCLKFPEIESVSAMWIASVKDGIPTVSDFWGSWNGTPLK